MIEAVLMLMIGVMLFWLVVFVLPKIGKERGNAAVKTITLADLSAHWTRHNGERKQPVFEETADEPEPDDAYNILLEIINIPDEKGYYRAITQDGNIYVHPTGIKYILGRLGIDPMPQEVNTLKKSLGISGRYVRYVGGKRDKADSYVKLPARDNDDYLVLEARKQESFSIILKEKMNEVEVV